MKTIGTFHWYLDSIVPSADTCGVAQRDVVHHTVGHIVSVCNSDSSHVIDSTGYVI